MTVFLSKVVRSSFLSQFTYLLLLHVLVVFPFPTTVEFPAVDLKSTVFQDCSGSFLHLTSSSQII